MNNAFSQIRLNNENINISGGRIYIRGSGILYSGDAYPSNNPNSFCTSGNLQQSGSIIYNYLIEQSGQVAIDYATKTQLFNTGSNLDSKINSLSGYATANYATISNLNLTGLQLYSNVVNLSGKIEQSGVLLQNQINSIVDGTGRLSGITTINGLSGTLNLTGTGNITITNVGNLIIISGSGGGGAGTTNNYYVNSGSGLFLFRSYVTNGVDKQFINYPTILDYNAFIVPSLRNDVDNTIPSYLTSGANPTGFWAIFSNTIGNTGYYFDIFACNATGTGLATTVIVNNSYGSTGSIVLPDGIVYTTGNQTISGIKYFVNTGIFGGDSNQFAALPNNPLSVISSGNYYLQVNIQNRATGDAASSDLILTASNGNDSSNYIDLGINNPGYNQSTHTIGTGNDGYLYVNGGNLNIGTQTAGKNIEFHAGGTTTGNQIFEVNSTGIDLRSGVGIRYNNQSLLTFTKGGSLYNADGIPSGTQIVPVWFASYPCQAVAVRGFILSGSSATVNVIKNNSLNLLSANLNIATTGFWYSSGILQNNSFNTGDTLSLDYIQNVDNPVSISIQIDFNRI